MTKYKILIIFLFFGLIIFLNQVFLGRLILPQFFHLGPFAVYYYGIIMALAVLAGWLLAKKRASQYGIDKNASDDIIFWIVIGGFVGARIYHVLSSAEYYLGHLIDIFKVWQGGLSIFGAIFGGLIILLFLSKRYALNATSLLDWLAPSLILGQIIGRFANLFNYEAFGYPTNLPWKMFVPENFRPENFVNFQYFHPWFLYEALGNALILFLLLKFVKNKNSGALFFSYLLCYNVLRFLLEFLRIDSTYIGLFRLNSLMAFLLILLAVLGLKGLLSNTIFTKN